jgi:predicted transposase/invertase (TIGR01784 family)
MKLDVDLTVDYAFKKVFGDELNAPVLIHLLHAVVQPTQLITGMEIMQSQSEKEAPLDKQAIGDVRARDQGKRHFFVEMQWDVPWYFPNRMVYYWSKFHSQQMREGEDYQILGPTIAIFFTKETVFKGVPDHHHVFRLRDEKNGLVFCEDVEFHLIELPKFTKTLEELSSNLDRWCYVFRHGPELDPNNLPPTLDVLAIRRALEVLKVFNQDEREREIYEARLKYQRDQSSLMREAREAEERGIEKGALLGKVQLCQLLLKQPETPQADLARLSQEELAALHAQLLKQLLPNGG